MKGDTVAIIGLGLIGGSLARDLAALGARVLGLDQDTDALRLAVREGVVDRALPEDGAGLEAAGLVVFALPVMAACEGIRRYAPRLEGAFVTDAGSTKRSILEAALAAGVGERFVGAHPLAGDHASGWAASRRGLFRDATVFLCPTPVTTDAVSERAHALWSAVGARPRLEDAAGHDARMAWLSHLPQAVASAAALAISRAGHDPAMLGPGGRDVTRLAASQPGLWADILLDNADEVEPALDALERMTGLFGDALRRRDRAGLMRLLAEAKDWKDGG